MTRQQQWYCRLLGTTSGILMAIPNMHPAAAPLQMVGLVPILWLTADPIISHRGILTAGMYMGLSYTLPQMIALRLPPLLTAILIVHLTVVLTVFAWGSAQFFRRSPIFASLAAGALLVVLDWANFTAVPVWGTAQSLARCWSAYPNLIGFVSLTGITGIVFALATLQALLVNLIKATRPRVQLLAAIIAVVLVFAAANLIVCLRKPTGTLKVAAVGWTSSDTAKYGGVHSRQGFEALFAGPVADAVGKGARLVVSPELGFYFRQKDRDKWLDPFRRITRAHDVFLAIGYFNAFEQENRIMLMNPEGTVLCEYTKTYLTPFEKYNKGSGKLEKIDVDGVAVGAMICQDDNFTRFSREYGRKQIGVVAVPTLDWRQVSDAHFQSSIHRAIESRYAIVRAASDGISAIISPTGQVLARRNHFKEGPGPIVADVPLYAHTTVFSRTGHWPVVLSLLFLAIYISLNFIKPPPAKQPPAA